MHNFAWTISSNFLSGLIKWDINEKLLKITSSSELCPTIQLKTTKIHESGNTQTLKKISFFSYILVHYFSLYYINNQVTIFNYGLLNHILRISGFLFFPSHKVEVTCPCTTQIEHPKKHTRKFKDHHNISLEITSRESQAF